MTDADPTDFQKEWSVRYETPTEERQRLSSIDSPPARFVLVVEAVPCEPHFEVVDHDHPCWYYR